MAGNMSTFLFLSCTAPFTKANGISTVLKKNYISDSNSKTGTNNKTSNYGTLVIVSTDQSHN